MHGYNEAYLGCDTQPKYVLPVFTLMGGGGGVVTFNMDRESIIAMWRGGFQSQCSSDP